MFAGVLPMFAVVLPMFAVDLPMFAVVAGSSWPAECHGLVW